MTRKTVKEVILFILAAAMLFCMTACVGGSQTPGDNEIPEGNTAPGPEQSDVTPESDENDITPDRGQQHSDKPEEKNGSVVILFTSDVHCAVNEGFGYDGLAQIRSSFENRGYETIL